MGVNLAGEWVFFCRHSLYELLLFCFGHCSDMRPELQCRVNVTGHLNCPSYKFLRIDCICLKHRARNASHHRIHSFYNAEWKLVCMMWISCASVSIVFCDHMSVQIKCEICWTEDEVVHHELSEGDSYRNYWIVWLWRVRTKVL